ncbi:helix-turn-helix domain-containing protein [Actinacidiphila paucisporea]|uniref:Helix-turn-helix domain-containing protein n=1 Tax=Actinacidiphila paucisporea TaxID=310782 RepID=A0A1M6Z5Z8_9ACTN|nr:helix-turn-helix transcriptional regulator [Actinacidiphila paucisporea]SHL25835.1 Helix-turn-helix domain-containing protein [Actinacidiphila paucisporea]
MVNRKELHPESSPEAAFGARIRGSREARGWTQDDLADRMEYSSKHISAIETARRVPTLRFTRSIDVAFGLVGTVDSFEREWREMRSGSLLEGFPEYVDYEGRAVEIRLYEVGVIPGLLQTPEYAAALADSDVNRGLITPEQARERVTLVADRQAALVRKPPPLIFAALDESCVRRPVGGPDVMDTQLRRLAEFAGMSNSVLQVAPFDMGTRRPLTYPITVLTLPNRSLMAYAESALRGHLERESTFVLPMLAAYHQLQAEAPSQSDSVAMIDQLRKGIP